MKFKLDFITNSSSSSYICDVSGEIFSERDASLSDFDLVQCQNGHTFLSDYLIRNGDEDIEYTDEDEEYVAEKHCPICQFKRVKKEDLFYIMAHHLGWTEKTMTEYLKNKYVTYKNVITAVEKFEKNLRKI
jgi:hypothetical protein